MEVAPLESSRTDETRSTRKQRAIMDAARTLFLEQGYAGTSMDEVAGLAGVSKQTVYKHFTDKESLFRAIVLGVTGTADAFMEDVTSTLSETQNLEQDLGELARRYIRAA